MSTATAQAQPNIALIKYWGKRDDELVLPATGSLSVTLDCFPTTTTVTVDPQLGQDTLVLNGTAHQDKALARVTAFLDNVRTLAGSQQRAAVVSHNTAPTGAGLASSASGFAALATAASAAYGLTLDAPALSRLARRGSGSAARSIPSGVSVWRAGDDLQSYAYEVPAPALALVIATVDSRMKAVSSREAMRLTRANSPFYQGWIADTSAALEAMIAACAQGDFAEMGRLTELNAMRMHALIQSTEPSIRYLTAASLAILDAVESLRAEGVAAYSTADAGPNVVVLCPPENVAAVSAALTPLATVTVARPGPGARLIEPAESPA